MTPLTPKQEKAITALLSTPNIAEAATSIGVSERVMYVWLKEPAFTEAYRLARQEALQQAISRLQACAGRAVKVLEDVMDNTKEKGQTRITAARGILEMAIKAAELEDLVVRVETLERMLYEKP